MSPPSQAGSNPGAPHQHCPQCGILLAMESRFCGNCGAVLEPQTLGALSAPSPASAVVAPDVARANMANFAATMVDPPRRPPEPAPAPVAPPPVAPPPVELAPAPAAPSAPVVVVAAHKTMLGVSLTAPVAPATPFNAAPVHAAPVTPRQPASGPMPVRNAQRTMMGAIAPPGTPGGPAAPPSPTAAPGMVQVANANKTMVGMSLTQAPPGVRSRSEAPPMMGGPAPGVPPDTMPPGGVQSPPGWPAAPTPSPAIDSVPGLPSRKRSSALPVGLGLLALVAFGTLATAIYLRTHNGAASGPPLDAQVASAADGALSMVVTLPGMPVGTVVRSGNQSATLDAHGQARLPLASIGSAVGAVDVPLEVTPPNATAFTRTARVVIAYRVDPDLSQLGATQPSLRLVFHVQPGAQLQVNGQPVVTDAHTGLGAATIDSVAPLPIDGRDALESSFDVRVRNRDGTSAQSTYHLRVPRMPLRLDRPPRPATTTATSIVVRGVAPGAQRVVLNGNAIAVEPSGAFQTVAPLPSVGHFAWTLIAYSAQGAPALARLDVTRAAAGDRAAETAFLAGSSAGANELAHAALPVGTRVRLRGRVLGAPREYEGGQTFQLVVDAPACGAAHCLAWVDVEPGSAVADGDTVEVAGTVTGDRAAQTASGRRTDPVIHAAFVL